MRIAFIGGTLFIGHAAAALLVRRGHQVSLLHRGKHPAEVLGARSLRTDRADPHDLIRALREARPDVVIDTRALTRPDAETTALALKILELPVVVLSSQDVYAQYGRVLGHPAPEPEARISEQSPLTVPYPYRGIAEHEGGEDYDKKQVESVFREAQGEGLPGLTLLRLPATYGVRDPKRRFGAIVDRLDRGERAIPHQGGAQFRWTHADVRDVGHAIALAAERMERGARVYNVGERDVPTMKERVEAIAQAIGVTVDWVETDPLPDAFFELGRIANDVVVDSSKIRRELGFSEVTRAEERVRDLLGWLRQSRARVS
jgi:nucleoside-diphosphate-sugar epimerase